MHVYLDLVKIVARAKVTGRQEPLCVNVGQTDFTEQYVNTVSFCLILHTFFITYVLFSGNILVSRKGSSVSSSFVFRDNTKCHIYY